MIRFARIAALALLAVAPASFAATTLTSSVTSANGQLATTLTWQSDRTTCVASGHPAWTGNKATSGTLTLPTITMSGTYTLKLDCSTPANLNARLTWTLPTQNTDGTTLTNLTGIRIHYGRSADALTSTRNVEPPAMSYTLEGLAPGQWFFAVRAYNSTGGESVLSNVGAKTVTAGVAESDTVTLTVNPIPNAPTGLTVE